MKQRKLEILLEQVEGFVSPDVSLEQYATPAVLAAEVLHYAYMKGDIIDTVYDLGCGTGILAIGAKLLGADRVVGFDSDVDALRIAEGNAEKLGVDVEFVSSDIRDVSGHAHTVVMNPPFGAQLKGSDRPFLLTALKVSDVIFSIHNCGSHDFIQKFITPAVITEW
ncbi:MAG: methyltransferase, partial [Methanosarcinaceae archaeon]|nr:methyltransferase [Methanosarcinaceae archaeon]